MNPIKSANKKLNGKKMPIALITFVILSLVGFGGHRKQIETNATEIEKLRPAKVQIGQLEVEMKHVKASLDKLEKRMASGIRTLNKSVSKTDGKIDQVLFLLAQKQ